MIRGRSRSSKGPPDKGFVNDLDALLLDALPHPRVPRLHGAGTVTALLPSGRMLWMHLRPVHVPAAEVNRLARSMPLAAARHAVATRATSLSIERLSRKVLASAQRLVRTSRREHDKVRRRIAKGDAALDRAITLASAKQRRVDAEEWRLLRKMAENVRRQDLWNLLVLVGSAPLFAAYGREGNPLAEPNLVLAISLGLWLVGDEISDFLTGEKRIRGGLLRDVDVWSYLAPFANVLSGWWLLREQQHERFVTGTATLEDAAVSPSDTYVLYTWMIDIAANHVAPGGEDEFRSHPEVPVMAAGASKQALGPVTASVRFGILTIAVEAESILTSLDVAWVVDTRPKPH